MIKFASCLPLLCLTGCASWFSPPVVSGDLSCEKFRHISATGQQIDVIAKNYETMESWAEQVAAHNVEYDKTCLDPDKKARAK